MVSIAPIAPIAIAIAIVSFSARILHFSQRFRNFAVDTISTIHTITITTITTTAMNKPENHKPQEIQEIPQELQSIFRRVPKWQELWFYQKSEVLYQMTYVFCERFLPRHGDRTVDQMRQAARSGKQNIVEGSEDGKTSTAMELNLLNVARSSISELRLDYEDHLKAHHLAVWTPADARFQPMQDFTKVHNKLAEYEPYFMRWTAEEMANVGLTLCYQVDAMMNRYMAALERRFVEEGGIKERMHKARTGYRLKQEEQLRALQEAVPQLEQQLAVAQAEAKHWHDAYDDLRQRALRAYREQQAEIERLKAALQG